MSVEVKVPELGEEQESVTVSFWIKEEGEQVEKGEDIVELIASKSTFNVSSPCKGKIEKIFAKENDVLKPGDILCTIIPE